ncbi:hypothetical protein AK830_g9979 [Neonectria ditissima]|uniref:Uncharacterized protein n=1 Tax=Neonectria ditissima TaxID=78410 RepID=A0A0P7ATU2_9HYPO|nr:hypothetical protein AK830_g9979 [Neonectria ditissima]
MTAQVDVKKAFKPLASIEVFKEGSSKTPKWIEGAGQDVFWWGCEVTLNELQGDKWVGVLELAHDGEGPLPRGWALYCTGEQGKVREV